MIRVDKRFGTIAASGFTLVKVRQVLCPCLEILPKAFCRELPKLHADADSTLYAVVTGILAVG